MGLLKPDMARIAWFLGGLFIGPKILQMVRR